MKYLIFIDVQNDNVRGDGAPPLAEETAGRICRRALLLKDRADVFMVATRLAHGDSEPALFGCLGSVVSSRPVRYDAVPRFVSIAERIMVRDGGKPGELAVCGFRTGTGVLRAALALRDLYPDAKVAILEDLCGDDAYLHCSALAVANANGISVETSADNLGISDADVMKGVADV